MFIEGQIYLRNAGTICLSGVFMTMALLKDIDYFHSVMPGHCKSENRRKIHLYLK